MVTKEKGTSLVPRCCGQMDRQHEAKCDLCDWAYVCAYSTFRPRRAEFWTRNEKLTGYDGSGDGVKKGNQGKNLDVAAHLAANDLLAEIQKEDRGQNQDKGVDKDDLKNVRPDIVDEINRLFHPDQQPVDETQPDPNQPNEESTLFPENLFSPVDTDEEADIEEADNEGGATSGDEPNGLHDSEEEGYIDWLKRIFGDDLGLDEENDDKEVV